MNKLSLQKKLWILSGLSIGLILLFLLNGLNANTYEYALSRRIPQILAIVLTGSTIAYSTVVFQTISNNRVLTPSILGLDSLYLLLQTVIIFLGGSLQTIFSSKIANFGITVLFMVGFALLLFQVLFKRESQNVFFLLLVGIIMGGLFTSLSTFMQMLIDPNEFLLIQDKSFASFNNVQTDLVWIAAIIVIPLAIYGLKYCKQLDVLSLGKDHAVNLGISYNKLVKKMLILTAVFISISTALVGPITFLGLLIANVSREFFKTYKHQYIIVGSMLISIIALVGGNFISTEIFAFKTPFSVIINFIGGVYFIYILLKEGASS